MCEHVLLLDGVPACLVAYGTVNTVLGFAQTTSAINDISALILEVYGPWPF
jgi:hypothetical protein